MISDILTYIGSYDEIRAITGLNSKELKDATLALQLYRFRLGQALESVVGDYPEGTGEENLEQIFTRVDATDDIHYAIQAFSIYVVADTVMESIGLRAFKVQSDGKASLTRFSAESTYKDTMKSIKAGLNTSRRLIGVLLGESLTEFEPMSVVVPTIDPVTGA